MGCGSLDVDCADLNSHNVRHHSRTVPPSGDRADWQFDPAEFQSLSNQVGGFTIDACSDDKGFNAHCQSFCSPSRSFLKQDLSGHALWCNFPFDRIDLFLGHYLAQKRLHPEISGTFVLPVWKSSSWWQAISNMVVLREYPAGMQLFTAPGQGRARLRLQPTRWPVIVVHDPAVPRVDAFLTGGNPQVLATASGQDPVKKGVCKAMGDALGGRKGSEIVDDTCVQDSPLTPDADGISYPTVSAIVGAAVSGNSGVESIADVLPECSSHTSVFEKLPRLLHVAGSVAGNDAVVFLDSGSQIDLVSSQFVSAHNLQIEPAELAVRLPNSSTVPVLGKLAQPSIRLGDTYVTRRDLYVMTMTGEFDVILGKGWHDDANPIISWPHNSVQIYEEFTAPCSSRRQPKGRYHRIGTTCELTPEHHRAIPVADEHPPVVHLDSRKAFKKSCKKGVCFAAYVRAVQSPYTAPELCAIEGLPGFQAAPEPLRAPQGDIPFGEVLSQFPSVFAEIPEGLPPDRGDDHCIELEPGAKPAARAPYRLSPAEFAECKKQIELYLKMGHIQPSKSPYGAPVLFVRKKDGTLRMCVDFRALNDQTVKDRFPLPRIDQMLDSLRGSTVFSKLDLAQGYHQVRVHPPDVYKTAFSTHFGHFEFTVMPFGLCNAPATFQRMMSIVLRPYIGKFCCVYLDDILIYSRTQSDHARHLKLVLEALRDADLHAKLSKCEFGLNWVKFLGHVVSSDGIAMDPDKVVAMADWPTPKSTAHVRSFLGLVNYYRRFIRDFARIALPLTKLTGKEVPFEWGPEQMQAFQDLKTKLMQKPVLQMPDMQLPFHVTTDACEFAMGAVLEQDFGNGLQPVAFFSKKLNSAQRNYPPGDQEALAIVTVLDEWRCYLQGSHFVVNSDHQTLQRLQHQPAIKGRRARFAEFLQEYDCTVKYIKGEQNVVADALSRRPDLFALAVSSAHIPPSLQQQLEEYTAVDEYVKEDQLRGAASRLLQHKGLYYSRVYGTLYVPNRPDPKMPCLRELIMRECHRSALSGHFSVEKVVALISRDFFWPHQRRSVAALVESCHECQCNKPANHLPYGLLKPLPIPTRCWEHVSLDLVTGLPVSPNGNNAVVVFVDRLSKMCHFCPCKKKISAQQMAFLFTREVIRHHGWPSALISDRDPRFDSDFWRALLNGSGTELRMSTPYHPQTDGQTERANRTMLQMLRVFAKSASGLEWESQLPWLEFAYNDADQSSTGYAPFFLCQGSNPFRPLKNLFSADSPLIHDGSPAGRRFTKRLQDALLVARQNLSLARARQKFYADQRRSPSPFVAGDYVLVDALIYKFRQLAKHKLSQRWYGPLLVIDADENTVLLRTPLNVDFHARANVSACKKYIFPPGETPEDLIPSQITRDTLEIGRIVGQRKSLEDGRVIEYRCRLKHPPHNTAEFDEWFIGRDIKASRLMTRYKLDLTKGNFVDGEFRAHS